MFHHAATSPSPCHHTPESIFCHSPGWIEVNVTSRTIAHLRVNEQTNSSANEPCLVQTWLRARTRWRASPRCIAPLTRDGTTWCRETKSAPTTTASPAYHALSASSAYEQSRTMCKSHPFNGLFSRTTGVRQYQKGKTSLDLNQARDYRVLGCSGIRWTICNVPVTISINAIALNFTWSPKVPNSSISPLL